jgi:UDP-glucose 4-epimerase
MRVVVTGGCGFIGSHTVELLVGHGAQVTVIDDLSSSLLKNLDSVAGEISFVQGDVNDEGLVRAALAGADCVLHLAALVSVQKSILHPLDSLHRNIRGFVSVLEAVRATAPAAKVVYASSAAVYGVPARLPLSETCVTEPCSPYGLEKLTLERYARLWRALHGIRCLGLRYFNVYGPRQDPSSPYSGVVARFVDAAVRGDAITVYGDGLQVRDFVHVSDVAEANRLALTGPQEGVFNIGSGTPSSLLDLVGVVERATGTTLRRMDEPARAGDIPQSYPDISAATSRLAYQPGMPLDRGIADLVLARRAQSGDVLGRVA